MSAHLSGYLAAYLYLFGVILAVTLLQKVTGMNTEYSRKLIHILIGATWLILYHFFWPSPQILIVPFSFIIINALSYRFGLFSAIERTGDSENHLGTVYFSIGITALLACALLWPDTVMISGMAVTCLCFGDGFAAICGTMAKHPIPLTKGKSLQGTLGCIAATLAGLLLFSAVMDFSISLPALLLLSAATGLLELVGHGLDNFSIIFGCYGLGCALLALGVL